MKKEKELDERRKNEKLILSPDHPVRKLLLRMRERHCSRIFPTTLIVDIEQVSMARNRNINFFFSNPYSFGFFAIWLLIAEKNFGRKFRFSHRQL